MPDMKSLTPSKKPWEQLREETDLAYSTFCQFLELPKRGEGENKRRYQQDLCELVGKSPSAINGWAKAWKWDERAKAYDDYIANNTINIAELEVRRQFSAELRECGKTLRDMAMSVLENLKPEDISAKNALAILNTGVEMEEKAEKIEQPNVKEQREQLVSEISNLLGGAAGKLAGTSGGGAGGTITAVERTISFTPGTAGPGESVREIQNLPGEVREGSLGGDVVEQTD